MSTEFSVGWPVTDRERAAITALPAIGWTAAVDADGDPRSGAAVAELTGVLPPERWPTTRPAAWSWSAANARTPASSCRCSRSATDGATSACSPTPQPGNWRSSTPGTAPTPGSKTASAAAKTPDWAASRPASSRSTPPG